MTNSDAQESGLASRTFVLVALRIAEQQQAHASRSTTAGALGCRPQVPPLSTAALAPGVQKHSGLVDARLQTLLDRRGGLATRREMLSVVPPWRLQGACRAGRIIRVLPGIYVDAALVREADPSLPLLTRVRPEVARRAALAYTGGRAALSRLTRLNARSTSAATRCSPP